MVFPCNIGGGEGGVTGKNGLLLLCNIKRKNEPSLCALVFFSPGVLKRQRFQKRGGGGGGKCQHLNGRRHLKTTTHNVGLRYLRFG